MDEALEDLQIYKAAVKAAESRGMTAEEISILQEMEAQYGY